MTATTILPLQNLEPEIDSFERAVIEGLSRPFGKKALSPKFLYDQQGSVLFDRICDCAEYYVTRTETAILEKHIEEMADALGANPLVFEFGSGASRKTRILLRHAQSPAAYVPIDISRDFLLESSHSLQKEFPSLRILPVCADFTRPLEVPAADELRAPNGRRTAFFPGSTIGNFDREEARAFLSRAARFLGPQGLLLLGVDLVKERSVLEPAYDDAEGITAAFNLNLLVRMKKELGATVDVEGFRHRAFFNEQEGRIEMHLESLKDQSILLRGHEFRFERGETIHTECSYKYRPEGFEAMAETAGFQVKGRWTDSRSWFAVYLLEAEALADTRQAA